MLWRNKVMYLDKQLFILLWALRLDFEFHINAEAHCREAYRYVLQKPTTYCGSLLQKPSEEAYFTCTWDLNLICSRLQEFVLIIAGIITCRHHHLPAFRMPVRIDNNDGLTSWCWMWSMIIALLNDHMRRRCHSCRYLARYHHKHMPSCGTPTLQTSRRYWSLFLAYYLYSNRLSLISMAAII